MMNTSMRLRAALVALALGATACGSSAATEDADASAAPEGATEDGAMEDGAMDDGAMDDGSMDDMDGDDHGGDHGDEHSHGHGEGIEVPGSMIVPTIALSAEPDPVSGHNLMIGLTDFAITPENASTDPVDGEGHLHLFIDGERISRFYNTAIHVDGLEPGEHTVMVEVSANNHSAYVVDGDPIMAMATITVEDSGSADPVPAADIDGGSAELAINAVADPRGGWNVEFVVDGFAFDAVNAGGEAAAGSGHIVLFVDGVELGRQYGANVYLPAMDDGDHEISAELRHNDTSPYLVDGTVVSASVTVTEEAMEAMGDATVVTASVVDGNVETASDRVEVVLGSMVEVSIESDVADEVHVHGYDLFADVSADSPASLMFVADVPGVFEIELEGSGLFLFEIQVS